MRKPGEGAPEDDAASCAYAWAGTVDCTESGYGCCLQGKGGALYGTFWLGCVVAGREYVSGPSRPPWTKVSDPPGGGMTDAALMFKSLSAGGLLIIDTRSAAVVTVRLMSETCNDL